MIIELILKKLRLINKLSNRNEIKKLSKEQLSKEKSIKESMEYYESLQVFDDDQLKRIEFGLKQGLDVSVFAKPEFSDKQMRQIRLGLKWDLDVSKYAKPELSSREMLEIRFQLSEEKRKSKHQT